MISYIRSDLAVSSKLKHTNSFCKTLGLHIPELELALITLYRPPKCPQFKFKESLEEVQDWLCSLEKEGKAAPTVLLSGDFNLALLEKTSINVDKLCGRTFFATICDKKHKEKQYTRSHFHKQ